MLSVNYFTIKLLKKELTDKCQRPAASSFSFLFPLSPISSLFYPTLPIKQQNLNLAPSTLQFLEIEHLVPWGIEPGKWVKQLWTGVVSVARPPYPRRAEVIGLWKEDTSLEMKNLDCPILALDCPILAT